MRARKYCESEKSQAVFRGCSVSIRPASVTVHFGAQLRKRGKGAGVFIPHRFHIGRGKNRLAKLCAVCARIKRKRQRQRLCHDHGGVDFLAQGLNAIVIRHFDLFAFKIGHLFAEKAAHIGIKTRRHRIKRDNAWLHHGRAKTPDQFPIPFASSADFPDKRQLAQPQKAQIARQFGAGVRIGAQIEARRHGCGKVGYAKNGGCGHEMLSFLERWGKLL